MGDEGRNEVLETHEVLLGKDKWSEALCYGVSVALCALGFASKEAPKHINMCLKMLWILHKVRSDYSPRHTRQSTSSLGVDGEGISKLHKDTEL